MAEAPKIDGRHFRRLGRRIIAAFEDAETKAASRAKGAASFRDAKKKREVSGLTPGQTYFLPVPRVHARRLAGLLPGREPARPLTA
jgi:hypothetical protein